MKHVIFGLIVLGITNLVSAQNEIAMATHSLEKGPYTKSLNKKSTFEKAFETKNLPIVIEKMHLVAAKFDITTLAIYNADDNATYKVTFDEGNHTIEAVYNQEGVLTSSQEEFNNVPLPFYISQNIAKKHPGWIINSTNCKITYKNSTVTKMVYKVSIIKDKKEKTLLIES